jgi:CheY-like chemotaxis protein
MMRKNALILLVDDDLDFVEINRHVLESQGYRVACASDPQDALRQMAVEKPGVVVTDLMMSHLDSGFSLSQQLKEDARFRDIFVIIVTAVSTQFALDFRPRTPAELAAMHADAYFDKPVAPQALVAKIEELLEARGGSDSP